MAVRSSGDAPPIDKVVASAYRIPTDRPEGDGTIQWNATGMIIVKVVAGGTCGLGYSYTQALPAAVLVRDVLAPCILERSAFELPALWQAMNVALRNIGRPGLGLMAISAIDQALWDLKARLLGVSLVTLWGRNRNSVPVYGSGGFTTYDDDTLQRQLGGWAEQGITAVKMKVGAHPEDDMRRVHLARSAIGTEVALMVDANGAYSQAQALLMATRFADSRVCWFEEPVSSDDLDGLRALREREPPGMEIAAGEYGWDARYFRRMLAAGAVDVLQADATRCGYTGFLQAAALCAAFGVALSAHCAPAAHACIASAVPRLKHLEYFHDHVRIENLFFEGVAALREGALHPDRRRPGHGLELREDAAAPYRLA